jgi:hypothetical protein
MVPQEEGSLLMHEVRPTGESSYKMCLPFGAAAGHVRVPVVIADPPPGDMLKPRRGLYPGFLGKLAWVGGRR